MKKKKTKVKKSTKSVKLKSKKSNIKKPANKSGVLPLNDRVLVRPYNPEELTTTSSGIIIPETVSKEKPEQGEVIALGRKVSTDLKVGDRVVFSRYGYDDIKINGNEYYILKEENILAIINHG